METEKKGSAEAEWEKKEMVRENFGIKKKESWKRRKVVRREGNKEERRREKELRRE